MPFIIIGIAAIVLGGILFFNETEELASIFAVILGFCLLISGLIMVDKQSSNPKQQTFLEKVQTKTAEKHKILVEAERKQIISKIENHSSVGIDNIITKVLPENIEYFEDLGFDLEHYYKSTHLIKWSK